MRKFTSMQGFLKEFLSHSIRFLSDNTGAQNISYANDDALLESLVLHTLPDFGPHGDGIINQNFLFAFLKMKDAKEGSSKRFQVIDGGLEFWNGILKAENSNFKWQGHTADMTANLQDPSDRFRFPIQTFTGSVVINKLHEAQNKGRAMMKNFARTLREQAETTIPNQFNSAFWNTSPSSAEPTSLPDIISATPTAGSLGGITRAGNTYAQNQVNDTAIADIGSEGGITAIERQKLRAAIGQGGRDSADVAIMDDDLYSGMVGFLATLNRYRPDDAMAQLDFDTIKLGNTTYSYENTNNVGSPNTITPGFVYLINSNYIKFKVLKDGNFTWNPDGFERVGQTLNKALYFWVFCNLTTNNPRAHVVNTNVSTA